MMTICRSNPGFDGMVVALCALAIVTRVTLDIEPAFTMRQDAFEGLAWTTLGRRWRPLRGRGVQRQPFYHLARPDSDPLVDQDAAGGRRSRRDAGGAPRGGS